MSTVYPTSLKRKLSYITVSAKGLSNGLSSIPNDGADFGPDTLLGATAPNQYGPPYTQTNGILEAVNYASAKGGGVVKLAPGDYYPPSYTCPPMVYVPSNVSVRGSGIDISRVHMVFTLGSSVQGSSAPLTTNAWLEDLTIDGTNWGSSCSAVGYNYVSESGLRRVKVWNVPYWNIVGYFGSGQQTSPSLYIIDSIFDRNNNTSGNQDMSAFNYNDKVYLINTVWRNNSTGSTCLFYSNQNRMYIKNIRFENVGNANSGLNGGGTLEVVDGFFADSGAHFLQGTTSILRNAEFYSVTVNMNGQFNYIVNVKRLNVSGQVGGGIFLEYGTAGTSSSPVPVVIDFMNVTVDEIGINPTANYQNVYVRARDVNVTVDPLASYGAGWQYGGFLFHPSSSPAGISVDMDLDLYLQGALDFNNFGPSSNPGGITYTGRVRAVMDTGGWNALKISMNWGFSNFLADIKTMGAPNFSVISGTTFSNAAFRALDVTGSGLYVYPSVSTPSVPSSGTAVQNTTGVPVNVYVMGGALTQIQITRQGTAYTVYSNSTASAVYSMYRLEPGDSITLTYSTAPSWTWLPA